MNDPTRLFADSIEARRIGIILVDLGKLRQQDVEQVLRMQRSHPLPFGEAAIKLGMLQPADVQRALALQYDYPYVLPSDDVGISRSVVTAYSPFSKQGELFRGLRTQLLRRVLRKEPRHPALAIVSPGHGEGRSYVAANLAVALAQSGVATLLIDADMRRAKQHALFNVSNQFGLSTVLAARSDAGAVHRLRELGNLSLLPAGPTPPNPLELLERSFFPQLLRSFESEFEAIILDTPAGAEHADAQSIASEAGAALIVTRTNVTRLKQAKRFVALIAATEAEVVGSVLNNG